MTLGLKVGHRRIFGRDRIGRYSFVHEGNGPDPKEPEVVERKLAGKAGHAWHQWDLGQGLDLLWNLLGKSGSKLLRSLRKPKRGVTRAHDAVIILATHCFCKAVALGL